MELPHLQNDCLQLPKLECFSAVLAVVVVAVHVVVVVVDIVIAVTDNHHLLQTAQSCSQSSAVVVVAGVAVAVVVVVVVVVVVFVVAAVVVAYPFENLVHPFAYQAGEADHEVVTHSAAGYQVFCHLAEMVAHPPLPQPLVQLVHRH